MCIDPLAEKYTYNSPYAFAENRVIDGRELEGLEWVDSHKNKNLVYDPSANNGKGDFTQYATSDHRNMAKSLNGTEAGRAQFGKLVNSDVPTTATLDKENSPVDPDTGGLILGLTEPVLSKNGNVKQDKDKAGNVVGWRPEGFTITLFEKNIDSATKDVKSGAGEVYGKEVPKGTTFSQIIGITFGHEIGHANPKDLMYGAKNPSKAEVPATNISNQIIDELNKK